MTPALVARQLGKRYASAVQRPLRAHDAIERAIRSPLEILNRGRRAAVGSEPGHVWALRDVSFAIDPGEVVGILGRNGAGKSVLLRIISRVTPPTEGSVTVRGSVAPLLEVGAGFHDELTGRDNIFLNGTILGMRHTDIARRVDAIVALNPCRPRKPDHCLQVPLARLRDLLEQKYLCLRRP